MIENLFVRELIVVLAFVFEFCFARRNGLFTKIIHPLALIGQTINFFDNLINNKINPELLSERPSKPSYKQIKLYQGIFASLLVLLIVWTVFEIVSVLLGFFFDFISNTILTDLDSNLIVRLFEYICIAFFLSMFFGYFQLRDHVEEVGKILLRDDYNQHQLSSELVNIVGRDTRNISRSDAYKAAIETLAENFSDAYLAPLFYYILFGFEGMLIYKTINVLDSCLGYKDYRYIFFGRFSAKLDDLANFIPARIAVIFLLLSQGKLSLSSYRQINIFAKNHDSPNAGLLEACLAYLLKLELGGARSYAGLDKQAFTNKFSNKSSKIGSGRKLLTAGDLQEAVNITNRCYNLILLLVMLMLAINIILL